MNLQISDLNDAVNIQVKLMAWESAYARHAQDSATEEELGEIRDLLERSPEYVARAYDYFAAEIDGALSKKQIINAWVCGESDTKEKAIEIYDLLMSSNLSITKARGMIREANGTPDKRGKYKTLAQLIADMVAEMEATNNGAVIGWAKKFALIPAVKKARRRNEQNTL